MYFRREFLKTLSAAFFLLCPPLIFFWGGDFRTWHFGLFLGAEILLLFLFVCRLLRLVEFLRGGNDSGPESSGNGGGDLCYQRGQAFHLRGKHNEAIREFKKIIASNPEDADACYQVGKIYKEKGCPRESERWLRRCLEVDKKEKWKDDISGLLEDFPENS